MTAYLVSGRAEIIPAWASVLTLFWSLATVFKIFSLCTTPHTCPFITFSYFPPCSLSLCAVSSHSFLCVSDNSCCQPPLPGVYSLLFFSLFSSSKLTLVLLVLVSFIAHNFLVFSSFLHVLFFLAAVFHTLRDLLLAAPAMLTYSSHGHLLRCFLQKWSLTTDFLQTFCSNTAKALAVSVQCPSLWMVRHLPSPAVRCFNWRCAKILSSMVRCSSSLPEGTDPDACCAE